MSWIAWLIKVDEGCNTHTYLISTQIGKARIIMIVLQNIDCAFKTQAEIMTSRACNQTKLLDLHSNKVIKA